MSQRSFRLKPSSREFGETLIEVMRGGVSAKGAEETNAAGAVGCIELCSGRTLASVRPEDGW